MLYSFDFFDVSPLWFYLFYFIFLIYILLFSLLFLAPKTAPPDESFVVTSSEDKVTQPKTPATKMAVKSAVTVSTHTQTVRMVSVAVFYLHVFFVPVCLFSLSLSLVRTLFLSVSLVRTLFLSLVLTLSGSDSLSLSLVWTLSFSLSHDNIVFVLIKGECHPHRMKENKMQNYFFWKWAADF